MLKPALTGELVVDDWNSMEKLKAEAAARERRRIDAGERPEYKGPSMDVEKFRFKDNEAREKRKQRQKERQKEQELIEEQMMR